MVFVLAGPAGSALGSGFDPSYSSNIPVDTSPFFPDAQYDQSVPGPNDYLLRPLGEWPLRYHELEAYFKALDGKSPRVKIETHGATHEGRKLYNVFISSPENIRNLDKIRADMATFADPKSAPRDADALIGKLPAVAWMAYSVHGDECSGVDAALAAIYQLTASKDVSIEHLLERLVIIIDPSQNPDGRERYLSMLETYRGYVPNYNMSALEHSGHWPWGRGNHYWFDMNRDWALVTQPETESRVSTILKWHPQLVVDAHELDADGTFLSNPPREPVNYNIPESVRKWWTTFGQEQGAAFDQHGWPHYAGEWFEAWYPGYGDFWPSFSGAIGILYEQARVGGGMIKQSGDYLLTYHEAVHHQFTATFANLTTLSNHRDDIMRDYRNARVQVVENGRKSGLAFVFPLDKDIAKQNNFIETLLKQGIEIQKAAGEFTLGSATDTRGNKVSGVKIPAGSFIVSTAQVQGALAKALLDFDPRLKVSFLEEERRYVQKKDESRIYDISAWSLPLAYNLKAYATTSPISAKTEPVTAVGAVKGQIVNAGPQAAYVVDMQGEATNTFLVKAFDAELNVRAAEKKFTIEGHSFSPGSLVFWVRGNPDSLAEILRPMAEQSGVNVVGVHSFLTSDGPPLGAPAFPLLAAPRVAIVTGDGIDFTSVGSIWFTIDKELGLPHSLLTITDLSYADLSDYNVIILPSSWGPLSDRLTKGGKENLDTWISGGGTLICVGSAAAWAADTATGLSAVRLKPQVLDKLDKFAAGLKREQAAAVVDTTALWYPDKAPVEKKAEKESSPSADETKELDAFQRKFSPQGVILRVDLNPESWLAFATDSSVAAMIGTRNVFLSSAPVKTIGRLADEKNLRLSGLLWPEARARWASTAYLTQESKGKGQLILFADDPNFRAYFWGTRQLLVNAILYGPGMGTSSGYEGHSDVRKN
jgi:hypothetical protein